MCGCKNVGGADRAVRLVIGIAALVLAFTMLGVTEGAALGIAAAVVGVIMLLTAAPGMCPLYLPLKLSACRVTRT
ncbi:MAG: DUF2892 domain-containing protein [Phycisphaerales bacterium]|nr:DUF2892 domain-containing protein [Phycisphaerales bacterium]